MTTFDLLLIGHGNVAKRFVSLLEERRAELARQHGIRARVIGIATRRDGCRYIASGSGGTGPAKAGHYLPARVPAVDFISDACARNRDAAREGRLVVVETTTLDVERGEPAISHVRSALAGGAHAITTNKGPAAFAYRSLLQAADRAGRRFLFEGAVMDGVPIFNLTRDMMPAVTIVGFRGIVNSTTNYILTAMEQGQPFAEALAEMQAMGIAEADPSLDVEGWDAAAKAAALANALMDAAITPRQVERHGISPDTGRLAREALASGRRLKLVARAGREGSRISTRVAPESLAGDDLLAGVEGRHNALILYTDLLDEIAIVQRGGGLTQTAYALVSDLVAVALHVTRGSAIPQSRRTARRRRTL
jgi:homoserine dehydrogenase